MTCLSMLFTVVVPAESWKVDDRVEGVRAARDSISGSVLPEVARSMERWWGLDLLTPRIKNTLEFDLDPSNQQYFLFLEGFQKGFRWINLDYPLSDGASGKSVHKQKRIRVDTYKLRQASQTWNFDFHEGIFLGFDCNFFFGKYVDTQRSVQNFELWQKRLKAQGGRVLQNCTDSGQCKFEVSIPYRSDFKNESEGIRATLTVRIEVNRYRSQRYRGSLRYRVVKQ